MSATPTVLLLGDPRLRVVSTPILDPHNPSFREQGAALRQRLELFRAEHGFGRAISAPQIAVPRRFLALHLQQGRFLMVNPEITAKSESSFTLWDDCMCFPDLLVKVRRHSRISVRFLDEDGQRREWNDLDASTSELLQHEIDHLDGILAVDRALDRDSLVSRAQFESDRRWFQKQVDYTIPPLSAP